MKKFRSLNSYFKCMDEFCDEEDSVFVKNDIKEFVGNDKFVIYDMISEDLSEEDLIKVRDKYYWICERYEGCKFLEVSERELEKLLKWL